MKKFYILIIVLVATLNFSCEDFLDRPPLDAISTNDYWKSSSDLEKYVLQFYPLLPQHGYGMAVEDANSDNLIRLTPNDVMNGVRGVVSGNWTNRWRNIRSINVFFDNYTKVTSSFETYRHFLGEAHFFITVDFKGLINR